MPAETSADTLAEGPPAVPAAIAAAPRPDRLPWLTRALVVVGLLGLLWAGSRASDPPDAQSLRRSTLIAVGFAAVVAAGLVATIIRRWRSWNPLQEKDSRSGVVAHAGLAVAATVLSVLPVSLALPQFDFGGPLLFVGVVATWWLLLAWLLDRLHVHLARSDDTVLRLLTSLIAAGLGITTFAVIGFLTRNLGSGLWWIEPVVAGHAVVAAVVVAGRVTADSTGTRGARTAALATALGVVLLVAGGGTAAYALHDDARATLDALAGDLYPGVPGAERACNAEDLAVTAEGWASASSRSSVALIVRNQGDEPCGVQGWPELRLLSDGDDLAPAFNESASSPNGTPTSQDRVTLAVDGEAALALWWDSNPGADKANPQELVLDVGDGEPLQLELAGESPRIDVIAGDVVNLTAWAGLQR